MSIKYNDAKNLAINFTLPGGKIHYSADAGKFYIFMVVSKNTPKNAIVQTGRFFTAVDKKTGRVYTYGVGKDPNFFGNIKRIE